MGAHDDDGHQLIGIEILIALGPELLDAGEADVFRHQLEGGLVSEERTSVAGLPRRRRAPYIHLFVTDTAAACAGLSRLARAAVSKAEGVMQSRVVV